MNTKRSHSVQTQYYSRLVAIFRHDVAFLPLLMIPLGFLVRAHLVDSTYYMGDTAFVSIVGTYLLALLVYVYMLRRYPQHLPYRVFMVVFNFLAVLFGIFISGFLSTFLATWIMLMVSADMVYETGGFLFSFACLAITAIFVIGLHPELPATDHFEIIQAAIIVGLVSYVIARIRSVTDSERKALVKSREQEHFQRERLLALVNSMGDAVVTTNETGSIKVYNAALLGLLDTNADLTGQSIDAVLQLRDQENNTVNILDDAQTTRKVFSRTDLSHQFNEDESMRLYINVAQIRPSYQSHSERGFIFIIRDITKEKTLEQERDEFISVISHELRTPIAIAEGNLSNIQILQERGATPDIIKHAAADAHEQIMYLAKMINDLATLSRAERGVTTEAAEEIDPTQLLSELYKNFLPRAQEKGLHLNLDLSPKLAHIQTSRLYIEEILQNFVNNALKYTKEGSITIIGHMTPQGVYLAVKDSGIGISKSDQRHIFQKFYRSEDYRTRESSGTGLGLYITKKLAEKMNLSIHFESRLNHGSTFSIVVKPLGALAKKAEHKQS